MVNGAPIEAQVEPRTHLADFVRESLGLTGTHLGCEHGVCGACTLEIDGAPVRGCITYAAACDGAEVRTIEGFADDPLMAALRAAFCEHHALQCGYCTPGMLITARDIVGRLPGSPWCELRMGLLDLMFKKLRDPKNREIFDGWLKRDECRWDESSEHEPGTPIDEASRIAAAERA